MIITATWLPSVWGYQLDAVDSAGPVAWYRSSYWPDGRTGSLKLPSGTQILDLGVPLDGPTVTYTAVDNTSSPSVTVNPPEPSKPVFSLLNRTDLTAAEVTVQSLRDQTVMGRSAFYDVLDANEPLVDTLPPTDRHGQMVLWVPHPGGAFPGATLTRLRRMLRSGEPMMLRTTCHDRVEDLAFVFMQWVESHTGDGNQHGPDRRITIDWRAINPIWGPEIGVTGRVWGLVPAEFATWADITSATWQDLVDGN